MKRLKSTKVIACLLAVVLVLLLNSKGASAEWKQDSKGWWNKVGSSWSIGWDKIDGKWYYFGQDGYMVHDNVIDGHKLGSDGAWVVLASTTTTGITDASSFIFDAKRGRIQGYNCLGTKVIIPSTINGVEVKIIGYGTFYKCNSLTSITIPNCVTDIEDCAFQGCDSLTDITIPDRVTKIGESLFASCKNLISITVNNDNPNYMSVDGILFDKLKTTIIQYPAAKKSESYVIPNSVTRIGIKAFSGCRSLTSITIPNSVTSIGYKAFEGCDNAIFYVGNEKTKQRLINDGIVTSKIILN